MKHDRLWERLVEYLSEWASAREVPGGIEVTFEQSPGVTRTVEVVMTAAEWDACVSIMYGTGDPGATTLRSKVLATPEGVPYLVYDNYGWEPSQTRELSDGDPDPGPGEWVVTNDGGKVIGRFADVDEQG